MGFLKVHLAKKSSVVQFENTKEFRIFKEIEIWHFKLFDFCVGFGELKQNMFAHKND